MSKLNWAETRAQRIGLEVKALRGRRSGQWLADETAAYGHTVSRTTISEIENGKRKDITLGEITVLARALRVPPLLLIYPDLALGPVEVLPGTEVTSANAARWFSGESPLPDDHTAFDSAAMRPLIWTRHLYTLATRVRQALNFAASIKDAPNASPADHATAADRFEAAFEQLTTFVDTMNQAGFDVAGEDIQALIAEAGRAADDGEG